MSEILGRLNPSHKQVTVIGGGVSGLLAAYFLNQKGYHIHLIEAQDRCGGLIQTFDLPWGIAESAAHSLLVTPAVSALFQELQTPLTPINARSRARYILRRGKLRRFPLSLFETWNLLYRACFKRAPNDPSYKQWSVQQWSEYHLGNAALKYLFAPMLQGIYGAKAEEICLQAAFPRLSIPSGSSIIGYIIRQFMSRLSFRKRPSSQARPSIMTPTHGMESLTQALYHRIQSTPGNTVSLGEKITQLPKTDNVILCTPAYEAAQLLKEINPTLSQALSYIEYTPLISVTVFIDQKKLKSIPKGLGVLIPESEGMECLGILFNSSSFPNKVKGTQDWISCTAFLGGSHRPELLADSDHTLIQRIEKDMKSLFGLEGTISEYSISRWNRAIPKYNENLMQALELAKTTWCAQEGHILFGNYTGSVSLRGMIESCSKL